jgi:hypothetical protein
LGTYDQGSPYWTLRKSEFEFLRALGEGSAIMPGFGSVNRSSERSPKHSPGVQRVVRFAAAADLLQYGVPERDVSRRRSL